MTGTQVLSLLLLVLLTLAALLLGASKVNTPPACSVRLETLRSERAALAACQLTFGCFITFEEFHEMRDRHEGTVATCGRAK